MKLRQQHASDEDYEEEEADGVTPMEEDEDDDENEDEDDGNGYAPPPLLLQPPPPLAAGQSFANRKLVRQAVRAFAASQHKSVRIHQPTNAGSTFAFVCKSPTPCAFEVKVRRPNRRTSSVHVITALETAHGPACTGKPLKRLAAAAAAAAAAPRRAPRASAGPASVTLHDGSTLTLFERQEFRSREELKDFVHDFALAQGKRARVDRTASGGNNTTFICTSRTPCSFTVRTLRVKPSGRHCVRSFVAAHGPECSGKPAVTKRQVLQQMAKLETGPTLALSGADVQAMVKTLQGVDVSARVASDARVELVGRALKDALAGVQKLESLLARFEALNPSARAQAEFDAKGEFTRAFLLLPHAARLQRHCPRVLGLVERAMRPASNLVDSMLLELVVRDSNNCAHTLAVGLVDARSHESYTWFLGCCVAHGVAFSATPLVCDRNSAVLHAVEALPAAQFTLVQCTASLLANLESRLQQELPDAVCELVRRAQDADSEAEFRSVLAALSAVHAAAADELRAVDPNTWAKHCFLGRFPLFGCQSAALVAPDAPPAAATIACEFGPFEFFQSYMERCMKTWYECKRTARAWAADPQRALTAFAETALVALEQDARACRVVPSDEDRGVAYVWDPRAPVLKKRRVMLSAGSCSCPALEQLALPCAHLLAAAHYFNADAGAPRWSVAQLGHAVYTAQSYAELFSDASPVEIPLEEELARNPRVQVAPAGSSNRCSLCHEIGHNRRRCTQDVALAPQLLHDAAGAAVAQI
ncbi:hypothetical protein PybrP1_001287 [[Pythium] brassicae (nom. inval.)]|nr:hypothetical protein PybrP1_001287 [[Pythium] brassicae (nom. inval.)]